MTTQRRPIGGVIHTYQKYDPVKFPSPNAPPPDVVSSAFEHLLYFGERRKFTEEELANAVRIDPRQIQGLGPSLEYLMQKLLDRKRKILSTYESKSVHRGTRRDFHASAGKITPPKKLAGRFREAVQDEQYRDLETLWGADGDEHSPFSRQLLPLLDQLSDLYGVDELVAKYEFTGSQPMTTPQALEIKEELETIDKLLEQLKEAAQNAQIGVIDLDELGEFVDTDDLENLANLQRQVQEYLQQLAEQQGLEQTKDGYKLTPKAYRLFQSKLLTRIFSQLQESRTGRHQEQVVGEGAVELQQTKSFEFGDSIANMDIPQTLINAMVRGGTPRFRTEDMVIHRTRNTPKCATAVLLDMSGSMRHGGQYINTKRMGLALDGLIRSEYPGDYLQFFEVYTFAKARHASEVAGLLPKPVTIFDFFVAQWYDMSDPNISEMDVHPHFTNIQHGLQLARQHLSQQDTPNRQIILITDGLPTAHFEQEKLFLLYPAQERTEAATMREAHLCKREGIVINLFLLPSWSQSSEDIQFAHRLAETTQGRVFFTSGHDLDRFVVWDYVNRRKTILGA